MMFKGLIGQVLKNKNFVKIWLSQILSQVTLNLVNFVIVIRIFETTHSTVAVSLVWIFYAMPALLIGPFSGTIVDLLEKRKILMLVTLTEAMVVLFYLLIRGKIWPIYSIIFLYSLVNQLYIPAEASTLTTVVPKKLLSSANSLFLFTLYGSFLVGLGSAGTLIRFIGGNKIFLLASLLLIFAFLAVYSLPRHLTGDKRKINSLTDFGKKVTEGYHFIRKNLEILFPLMLLVLINVIISVFTILSPLVATEILGIELLDIGLFLILPAGLGAVLGALGVVYVLRRTRKKKVISFGLFLSSLVLLIFCLIIPKLTLLKLPLAMLVIFLLGMAIVSIFIPAQTSLQEKTPQEFRGRVFGVLGFVYTLAAVVPVLLAATIADIVGLPLVIFLISIGLLALAVFSLKEPYAPQETYGIF